MKHATLRQLKVFEAVARLSSFSRAAEELHLTQPAVSTQIRKLEGHTGLPLFEQLGKKIYLTAAGTELLHHGHLIIRQFEEAEAAMTHFKGVSRGPFRGRPPLRLPFRQARPTPRCHLRRDPSRARPV